MLKIGLTGGIGSGKSTVAKIFETLGIPVYYADKEAKRLMNSDDELIFSIKKNFGEEIYKNGELDRTLLASIVFNDRYKLDLLNSLVHPVTIRDAEQWAQKQKSPYTIKEAALLFEAGSVSNLDHVIGVSAPTELRINRAMKRNNTSREEVINRMNQQINEEIKMRLCDFIIYNDEKQFLISQVLELHQKFLSEKN